MAIDLDDELKKRRIKKERVIAEIQQYMEEQYALERVGKMGHREVKLSTSIGQKDAAIAIKLLLGR